MCLYNVNRYAWYIGHVVNRDIVRRLIINSGVYSYAIGRRVESCGISRIPTNGRRVESIKSAFPGYRYRCMIIKLTVKFFHFVCGTQHKHTTLVVPWMVKT